MLRTLLRDESNHFRVVEDPSAIGDIVQRKDRYLWLDLEAPSLEEFRLLQEEFGLHPLAVEDAMIRHQRPKVDQYDNFYLVVFYSVAIADPDKTEPIKGRPGLRGTRFLMPQGLADIHLSDLHQKEVFEALSGSDEHYEEHWSTERIILRELTMFIGENYLITVHRYPIEEIEEAASRWHKNVKLIGGAGADVPGTRPLSPQERQVLRVQEEKGDDEPAHPDGDSKAGASGPDGNPSKTPEGDLEQKSTLRSGAPGQIEEAHKGNGRVSEVKPEEEQPNDIGILLYSLLDSMVDNYFPVVDAIVDRVEEVEEQIFEKYDQRAIETIFNLKKDLLALRKVLAPERDVLNVLTRRDLPIFDRHTLAYFQDVYDHIVRVTDSIDTYRDLLTNALESYLSMQSNRLNVTVQTLTSVSIMLMSIAAVTGWYGMNFEMMPELHSRFGYPGVMVVVTIIAIVEFIFFKRKGWL